MIVSDSNTIIINDFEWEKEKTPIFFFLDFKMICFYVPNYFPSYGLNKEQWQLVVNETCDILGIPPKTVFATQETIKSVVSNNGDISVPLSEPCNTGYRWVYWTTAKVYDVARFWDYRHRLFSEKTGLANVFNYKLFNYFEFCFLALRHQGVLKTNEYFRPSKNFLSLFIKTLENEINGSGQHKDTAKAFV